MLVARAQLNYVKELVARFARDDGQMQPIAVRQSQYVAIVAMLRSVGHVFDKVDCADEARRRWSASRWKAWRGEPIFADFIEPNRNALLKEFRGGLELSNDAFGDVAVTVDPSVPGMVSLLAPFDASKARDGVGRPMMPLFYKAIEFWDIHLAEAEADIAFRGGILDAV
ncbi:hypothetical protein [Sphingomonas aurantiaca]|uniref:hypothetical protein n=1 Tax=Sphingomonas aurantiaca TaxID=185949 RepID=UPI00336036E8